MASMEPGLPDVNGALYRTAVRGGPYGRGAIFKFKSR
jgi:uncharacterized repeat protein (TIGR03803 family)